MALYIFFFFYRDCTHGTEFSEAKCSSTRDEVLQTELVDTSNQERFDGHDNHRLENNLAPQTSKHDSVCNQGKVEVGKKQQTYSGPLLPSGVSAISLSERGLTSERYSY